MVAQNEISKRSNIWWPFFTPKICNCYIIIIINNVEIRVTLPLQGHFTELISL